MGYTHYWRQSRSVPRKTWAEIVEAAREIVAYALDELPFARPEEKPLGLAWENDRPTTAPQLDHTAIRFNGIGDEGHETFIITRILPDPSYPDENVKFDFCKTARKPYDLVVTATLAALDSIWPELFEVSSDGWAHEWERGVDLARRALRRHGNMVDTPRSVKDKSRYRSFVRCSKAYWIAEGHDGLTYIERRRDLWRAPVPLRGDDEWSAWLQEQNRRLRRTIRLYGSFGPEDRYEDHLERFCRLVWRCFGQAAVPPTTLSSINLRSAMR